MNGTFSTRRGLPLLLAAAGALGSVAAHPRDANAQLSREQTQRISRDHFQLGSQYFQQGRYAEAAREFQSVYDVSQQTEMLFNVGRAYEAAGDVEAALRAYELFLTRGSPSIDPATVHARVDTLHALQARAAQQAAGPAAPQTPAPAPAPAPAAQPATPLLQLRFVRVEYHRSTAAEYGPFVAAGLGLVLGGLAVWQGVAANQDTTLYNQANTGMVAWGPDVQRASSSAPTETAAAYGLGIAGGVFLLAGVGWLIFRGPGERREIVEAAVTPVPGGAVFSVGGSL